MTFITKDWQDAPSEDTPLDADALEDLETRLSGYTDDQVDAEAQARAAADAVLDTRVDALETNVTTIAEVPGLQASLDALQASATAATDDELAAAVATLNSAIAGKQDAASAATDAELAAAVSTINTSLAAKQDASGAATDAELASAVSTVNAAIALDQPLAQKGQPNGYAGLDGSGLVPQAQLPTGDPVTTVAASGAAYAVPQANGVYDITLTAACAFTFPAAAVGKSFTLLLRQDATGSRVPTWPACKWPGGAAPQLTATAGAVDIVSFMSVNGTDWLGFPSGYDLR